MTAPDAREWFRIEMTEPIVAQIDAAMKAFDAAHPNVTWRRHTFLGIERNEPWLCIDGWLIRPDDQGPPPTDADIPIGFW